MGMVRVMPMVMGIQSTTKTDDRTEDSMDTKEKQKILKSVVPKAILKALTDGSKYAITRKSSDLDAIAIYNYPFKIGREARIEHIGTDVVVKERHNLDVHTPTNDAYLVDSGKFLQISRRHCSITIENNNYVLKDRGSTCGCFVNGTEVGNNTKSSCELKDGDIVTIGSHNSSYKYQFITFDS